MWSISSSSTLLIARQKRSSEIMLKKYGALIKCQQIDQSRFKQEQLIIYDIATIIWRMNTGQQLHLLLTVFTTIFGESTFTLTMLMFSILQQFLLVSAKLLFWEENWALVFNSMKSRDCPDFFHHSTSREASRIYHIYYL